METPESQGFEQVDKTEEPLEVDSIKTQPEEVVRPQEPLTDQQIMVMEERRGRMLTQEEIDSINTARARGIHHDIV